MFLDVHQVSFSRGLQMLVVMSHSATAADVDAVCAAITSMGYTPAPMPGAQRTAVGLIGNDGRVDDTLIAGMPGVAQVIHVSQLRISRYRASGALKTRSSPSRPVC